MNSINNQSNLKITTDYFLTLFVKINLHVHASLWEQVFFFKFKSAWLL